VRTRSTQPSDHPNKPHYDSHTQDFTKSQQPTKPLTLKTAHNAYGGEVGVLHDEIQHLQQKIKDKLQGPYT